MKRAFLFALLPLTLLAQSADSLQRIGAGGNVSGGTVESKPQRVADSFKVGSTTDSSRPTLNKLFSLVQNAYHKDASGQITSSTASGDLKLSLKVLQKIDTQKYLVKVLWQRGVDQNFVYETNSNESYVDGDIIRGTTVSVSKEPYEYTSVLGAKRTVRRLVQVTENTTPKLTQEDFVAALKAGKEFQVMESGEMSCPKCRGRGKVSDPLKPTELTPSKNCVECASGKVKFEKIWTITW